MDSRVWGRITEIFDAVLERPANERREYLERACTGDPTLFEHVVRLLDEFDRLGNFLEQPCGVQSCALLPGDILNGRYRIERLLGEGGMGEVYVAHDELVSERVALKTLRRDVADNASILSQFRREVQLARKVTHPNVCRVFDIGIHKDERARETQFFTMQLLEGETLAARLSRGGPLSTREAYALVVQMAAGLDAAHQAGIIHRDFKSANVMLCDGRAVITDFGLARFTLATATALSSASVTSPASIAGTLAYMSPEQLAGGTVTTATDIYALGVVIFEMLSGRLPFDDRHIIQSAMQRAAHSVPDVRALAPAIEPRWAAAVGRCLQRDAAKRFQTAGDVAGYLRPRWRPAAAYWTRRQWLSVAAVSGVAAAGAALVPLALRQRDDPPILPEGAQVLLAPIVDSTKEQQFKGAITELFRNQLAQSIRLRFIGDDSLRATLKQMGRTDDADDPAAMREAGWRLNAVLSIFGTVSRVGPEYVLNVTLETRGSEPGNPRTNSLRSFTAPDPDAVMRSVREATLWIRAAVGESAATIASFDRLPSDTTTSSWEALRLFAQGQKSFMQNNLNPAIDKYREALEKDPNFTLAAIRIADLLVSQDKQHEGFVQWKRAMALLPRRPVTRAEELYARGMYALDTGNLDTADQHFRAWALEYPYDWRGPYYRLIPLCLNGHASQALELLQQLQPALPEYGDLYAQMIACHLMLGRTKEARALVPSVRKYSKFPERADLREGFIRFREADLTGALDVLRDVQRSKSYPRGAIDAMIQEALLLIDAGYPAAAAANCERFLRTGSRDDTAAQQTGLRVAQAWGEMLSGQAASAREHARLARDSAYAGPLVLAFTGTVFARTGSRALADDTVRECEGFQEMPLYRWARFRILGEQAKARGNLNAAIAHLRSASDLEPALAHRQYLIDALPDDSPERLARCIKAVQNPWQNLRPPLMHHMGAMGIAVPVVNAAGVDDPFARKFAEASKALQRFI